MECQLHFSRLHPFGALAFSFTAPTLWNSPPRYRHVNCWPSRSNRRFSCNAAGLLFRNVGASAVNASSQVPDCVWREHAPSKRAVNNSFWEICKLAFVFMPFFCNCWQLLLTRKIDGYLHRYQFIQECVQASWSSHPPDMSPFNLDQWLCRRQADACSIGWMVGVCFVTPAQENKCARWSMRDGSAAESAPSESDILPRKKNKKKKPHVSTHPRGNWEDRKRAREERRRKVRAHRPLPCVWSCP